MKRAASAPSLPVVLLTGFEPFGGEATNPSWEAVRVLQDARIGGHRIETRCLPVAFGAAGDALRAAIRATRPALRSPPHPLCAMSVRARRCVVRHGPAGLLTMTKFVALNSSS